MGNDLQRRRRRPVKGQLSQGLANCCPGCDEELSDTSRSQSPRPSHGTPDSLLGDIPKLLCTGYSTSFVLKAVIFENAIAEKSHTLLLLRPSTLVSCEEKLQNDSEIPSPKKTQTRLVLALHHDAILADECHATRAARDTRGACTLAARNATHRGGKGILLGLGTMSSTRTSTSTTNTSQQSSMARGEEDLDGGITCQSLQRESIQNYCLNKSPAMSVVSRNPPLSTQNRLL